MRKKIIAGNWKMNNLVNEAEFFVNDIKDRINVNDVDVVICPNYLCLDRLSGILEDTNIHLGAQNVYYEDNGAYTGEVSAKMLSAINVEYCIVGHSERRILFEETNKITNMKAKKLLEVGISPIVCVGETLEERNSKKMFEVIEEQVINSLDGICEESLKKNVVIAYEPIWAIGTGITATSEQAEEMCKFIRDIITNKYSKDVSDNIRILYGGSVKKENAKEILTMENIDGALVGGASLKNDFVAIVNYD